MIKKTVKFIHSLRLYLLAVIIVGFFFVSGLNPVDISVFFGAKLGRAIGMSVGVPNNPFNKLALELKQKEVELDQREKDLIKQEEGLSGTGANDNLLIYGLGIGIFILFVLVGVNFYFDRRRRTRIKD